MSLLYRFTRIVSYRPQRSQSLCANHLRCLARPCPCVCLSCSPPPPLPLPLLSLCFSFTWAGNVIRTWMNKFLYVNILRQKRNGIVNILWCDGMSFSFLSSLFFFLCLIFDDAKRVYNQVKKKNKPPTNPRSKLVSRNHMLHCSQATAGPVGTVSLTPVAAIPSTCSSSPLGETVNTAVTREVWRSRTDRSWRAGQAITNQQSQDLNIGSRTPKPLV